ncbi:MAG: response regulator [Micrococcales bacterium]|nr:response regulator [Micrococcales bacterium]
MIRVLIVDDDFMVARIHRGFVERINGFEVVGSAGNGADALTAAAGLEPDLVLLDLYLPDAFGLDVTAQLAAEGVDADVMVISAAKEADTVRRAVRQGVVDYLLKPFAFEDLRVRLERYAAARHRMNLTEVTGQDDIDRALGRDAAGAPGGTLPKGLSPETLRLVEDAVAAADSVSATECAEAVGLSRVSARRYLEHLVTTGRASVTLRYGTTGRPERRYARSG